MADPMTDGNVHRAEDASLEKAKRPAKGFVEIFRRITRSALTDGAITPSRSLREIPYKRDMLPCRRIPAQDAAGIAGILRSTGFFATYGGRYPHFSPPGDSSEAHSLGADGRRVGR